MDTASDYAEVTGHAIDAAPIVVRLAHDDEPQSVALAPRRAWTTGQITVTPGGPPVRLVGRNPFRQRVVIRTQSGAIYVGPTAEGLTANSGMWIGGGGREEFTTWYDIWVIADPSNSGATSPTFMAERMDG
jgi:hypothetical protein